MPNASIKIRDQSTAKSTLDRVRKHREGKRDCKYGQPESLSRRRRLEKDPEAWLRYYLSESFPLPFSRVHCEYITDLEYICINGGWKAIAMPRGCGKTTIALGFALYAILTGASWYLMIISATATQARENSSSLKTWLQHNDKLAADYPEVCAPIRYTKGIPQAMNSITANGGPVNMKWTANQLVIPGCPRIASDGKEKRSASENAVIECDGITGSLRGRKYDRPDGKTVRPDMGIVDDPQTPESARSPEQCRQRLSLIKSDIAGLGGPGRDIKIVVPCTIMEPGDLADELTNIDISPDFLGQRHPFFISMPDNLEAWDEYNEVRVEGLAQRDRGRAAISYYRKHREELDAGADVVWPERSGDGALNGIQWGMNQFYRLGEKAFATELQNQPIPPEEMINIKTGHVEACTTDAAKWRVPFQHLNIVSFIDCNPRTSGLHWAVVAFGEKLAAHVLAYGRYPQRGHMVPDGASETEEDALLFEGLRKVCGALGEQTITDMNGKHAKIDLMMIDGGYKFTVVQNFVQSARFPYQIAASRGRAASKYMAAGRDVIKAMNYIHLRKNARNERYLSHNACVLREIVHRAFIAGPDAPGGIGIYKGLHEEFAEQICSQRLTDKALGDKGMLYKWSLRPGGQDHWLDCIVGAYGGAHWYGIETAGEYSARRKPKKRKRGLRKVRV